jgi:hypothetical protein
MGLINIFAGDTQRPIFRHDCDIQRSIQPCSTKVRLGSRGGLNLRKLGWREKGARNCQLRLLRLVDPSLNGGQILDTLLIGMDNKLCSGVGNG